MATTADSQPIATKYAASPFPADQLEAAQAAADDTAEDNAEDQAATEEAQAEEVSAAEPQTEPAVESAVDQPAPLVEEAVSRYGFSREEATGLGDQLVKVLARMDRQALTLLKERDKGGDPPNTTATAPPPTPPAPPVELPKKLELKLDPSEYDETQIATFTALQDAYNSIQERAVKQDEMIGLLAQALVQQDSSIGEFQQQAASQVSASFTREMDAFFASLHQDFHDIYGVSPMAQLTSDSPLVKSRNDVVEQMRLLEKLDAEMGRSPATAKEYASRALRILHEDKVNSAARRAVEQKVAARRKQAIAAPSGRNGKTNNSRANALRVIEQKLADMGLSRN